MADVTLSSALGSPRRKVVTLTASNASVPIPSWAQGGKGTVRVTGTAPGGGGRVNSGAAGTGGGGGAWCRELIFNIPSGVTTIGVTIGSAGTGATNVTAATSGTAGGNNSVTINGNTVLTLNGGASSASPAAGGAPSISVTGFSASGSNGTNTATVSTAGSGIFYPAQTQTQSGVANGTATASNAFGQGGLGGRTDGVTAASGANGGPGIMILEFVEGF